jgi:hypothetical protein
VTSLDVKSSQMVLALMHYLYCERPIADVFLLVVELAVSRFPDLTLSSSVCSSRSLRLHFIFINKLNVCDEHYLFHVEVVQGSYSVN